MNDNKGSIAKVNILRGNAEKNWYEVYEVPFQDGESVYSVLHFIADHFDPTLAFSGSCRIGLCTACLVRVNNKVVRACTTLIKGDIVVEPYRPQHVIRDLVVDPFSKSSNRTIS